MIDQIIEGDCLAEMGNLSDNSIDFVVTSPPYPGNNSMWGDLYKLGTKVLIPDNR